MAEIENVLTELQSISTATLETGDPRVEAIETIVNQAEMLSAAEKQLLRNILVINVRALHDRRKPLPSTNIAMASLACCVVLLGTPAALPPAFFLLVTTLIVDIVI
jgi:hypothetical protein